MLILLARILAIDELIRLTLCLFVYENILQFPTSAQKAKDEMKIPMECKLTRWCNRLPRVLL